MASILTNTSAMVALQNLRTINADLVGTQNEIATGKKVATAKDNSAIWAVSKVIESDVNSFQAISDSLNLGDSTISVAREAAETVTDLLTELKGNIVAAQEENVDRSKIQADIDTQVSQIQSIVSAATFNGLSLVEGTEDVTILGSLQRDSLGNVTSSEISIARGDLTNQAGQLGTGAGLTDLSANVTPTSTTLSATAVRNDGAASPTAADIALAGDLSDGAVSFDIGGTVINFASGELNATAATAGDQIAAAINAAGIEGISVVNNSGTLEFSSTVAFSDTVVSATSGATGTVGGGASASITLDERAETFAFSGAAVNEGDGYRFAFGSISATYVAGNAESMEDVVRGLKLQIDSANDANITTQVVQNGTLWELKIDNAGADETVTITANNDANDNAVVTGGLAGLDGIDVTTNESAAAALSNIDTFINTAIDAAASFGSDQSRIDLQSGFITKLTDSLKQGIGSLVDADLEATSARLQALQVQQQLGIQSLSIANQAPQSILSLFR